jgi:hypothetical protein
MKALASGCWSSDEMMKVKLLEIKEAQDGWMTWPLGAQEQATRFQ